VLCLVTISLTNRTLSLLLIIMFLLCFILSGFEKAPRSIAAKCLGCVWFAFVTIFLTTFIAGVLNNILWASMDHTPRTRPSSLYPIDLGHLIGSLNNPYKCGTIANSQTYDYIQRVAVGEEFDALRR